MSLCVCLQGVRVVWLHQSEAATHSTHASFSFSVCEKNKKERERDKERESEKGSQNSEERRAREEEEEEEEEGSGAKIRRVCSSTYGREQSIVERGNEGGFDLQSELLLALGDLKERGGKTNGGERDERGGGRGSSEDAGRERTGERKIKGGGGGEEKEQSESVNNKLLNG